MWCVECTDVSYRRVTRMYVDDVLRHVKHVSVVILPIPPNPPPPARPPTHPHTHTQDVDVSELTLEHALILLGQQRVLGVHPKFDAEIAVACPHGARSAMVTCGSFGYRISKVL